MLLKASRNVECERVFARISTATRNTGACTVAAAIRNPTPTVPEGASFSAASLPDRMNASPYVRRWIFRVQITRSASCLHVWIPVRCCNVCIGLYYIVCCLSTYLYMNISSLYFYIGLCILQILWDLYGVHVYALWIDDPSFFPFGSCSAFCSLFKGSGACSTVDLAILIHSKASLLV